MFVFVCPRAGKSSQGSSVIALPTAGQRVEGGVLTVRCVLLSYHLQPGPSVICCAETVQSALSFSSGGTAVYIYSVCGRGEFRVFLC